MSRLIGIFIIGLLLCGCTASEGRPGPEPIRAQFEPWVYAGATGSRIRTDHYLIHTTIQNRTVLLTLGNVMEEALRQYQDFTPGVRITPRPMECYVFSHRAQWAQFTRERTGNDAAIYLQISRGGYTVRDWYVAYFIGDAGTYAVAAHEGWHQYIARHFKSRLPPFLEEGIASMFEAITWSNGRPQWRFTVSPMRINRLRRAIEEETLWPLERLITMHAGDVVGLSGDRIETFYAQSWAFAMFLWEAENSRHRPALQRMLSDLAAGTAPVRGGRFRAGHHSWDPNSAKPLLQHYLNLPLAQIEKDYLNYIRFLTNDRRRESGS